MSDDDEVIVRALESYLSVLFGWKRTLLARRQPTEVRVVVDEVPTDPVPEPE